jgi:hypothetical protein
VDATTIRHMIVFGVCTLGVGGLYLMPSVATPPPSVSIRPAADEPQPVPSSTSPVREPQSVPGEAGPNGAGAPQADPSQPVTVQPQPTGEPTKSAPNPTAGRTAYDPQDAPDDEPPSTVASITPTEVTADTLSLTWPAATDNRRVIGYRILLNGYEVATTAETQVKVRWFNDEEGQHIVQIKAIDAAGNQSTTWTTLLVTRPSPEATPSSTSTQTPTAPTPTPTTSPSPTETQDAAPTAGPTAQSSSAPTESVMEPSVR